MAWLIVYAGVLVICSAELGKLNSLRPLWRILCNFACPVALAWPLLLLSFSDISLNFCGLVASATNKSQLSDRELFFPCQKKLTLPRLRIKQVWPSPILKKFTNDPPLRSSDPSPPAIIIRLSTYLPWYKDFQPYEKPWQHKKYHIFSRVFYIANQLLNVTGLSRYTVRLMSNGEAFTIRGRLSEFFRFMAAKTLKNLYHLQTVTSKLS